MKSFDNMQRPAMRLESGAGGGIGSVLADENATLMQENKRLKKQVKSGNNMPRPASAAPAMRRESSELLQRLDQIVSVNEGVIGRVSKGREGGIGSAMAADESCMGAYEHDNGSIHQNMIAEMRSKMQQLEATVAQMPAMEHEIKALRNRIHEMEEQMRGMIAEREHHMEEHRNLQHREKTSSAGHAGRQQELERKIAMMEQEIHHRDNEIKGLHGKCVEMTRSSACAPR